MIKDATQKFIGGAGIELSPILYNGKPCKKKKKKKNLATLCDSKHSTMDAIAKKQLKPEKLPLREGATYFHSLRIYLQMIQW